MLSFIQNILFFGFWLVFFLPTALIYKLFFYKEDKGFIKMDEAILLEKNESILFYLKRPFNWLILPVIIAFFIALVLGILSDGLLKVSPFLYPLF